MKKIDKINPVIKMSKKKVRTKYKRLIKIKIKYIFMNKIWLKILKKKWELIMVFAKIIIKIKNFFVKTVEY